MSASVARDDRAMTAVYLAPGYGGIIIILRCALAAAAPPPSVGAGDKWQRRAATGRRQSARRVERF
jgi:hypothetical protein